MLLSILLGVEDEACDFALVNTSRVDDIGVILVAQDVGEDAFD